MIREFSNAKGLCGILKKTCVYLVEGREDTFLAKEKNVSKGKYMNI